MTVGEKIQYYRKNMHMSQDELGQKLNVSRQTISLWETGQTLPTIDNLILLKEIFIVTLDELLSLEEIKNKDKEESVYIPPVESITVNLNHQEFRRLHKQNSHALRFGLIVNIVIFVALLLLVITEGDDYSLIGVPFGLSIMSFAMSIKSNVISNNKARSYINRTVSSVYRYDMYEDFVIASVLRDDECINTEKIYYRDIDKINILKDFYVFTYAERSWIVKRKELSPGSLVEKAVKLTPKKKVERIETPVLKRVAAILNVVSLMSVAFGMLLLTIFKITGADVYKHFWIFALFIPITVGAAVLGFYLKKTADSGRLSIVIGIAVTALLIVISMFTVIIPVMSRNATECLNQVEVYTNMEVPHYSSYNITTYTGTSGTRRVAEFTFSEKNAKPFENMLMFSDKWMISVPTEIAEVAGYGRNLEYADYYFVYNLDTGEINTAPEKKGAYNFFNGYYDTAKNRLVVVEFSYSFK